MKRVIYNSTRGLTLRRRLIQRTWPADAACMHLKHCLQSMTESSGVNVHVPSRHREVSVTERPSLARGQTPSGMLEAARGSQKPRRSKQLQHVRPRAVLWSPASGNAARRGEDVRDDTSRAAAAVGDASAF